MRFSAHLILSSRPVPNPLHPRLLLPRLVKSGRVKIAPSCPQVDLEGRFDEAQPTPKASPVPSPPSNSPPEAVQHQPSVLVRPSQQGPKPGGTRKIKAEAFILNPLKGKADLPQIRRLESMPKVASA